MTFNRHKPTLPGGSASISTLKELAAFAGFIASCATILFAMAVL